jgi:hypothetical protein
MNPEDKSASHPQWVEARVKQYLSGKAGIIGSGSGIGQAVQGAASIAVPGDLSEIRSPVRSRLWSAVTPGGGGIRRGGAPNERGYRCPEGYQFGGRFTDSKWSTCGRQLFDLPSLSRTLLQIAEAAMKNPSGIGFQNPDVNPLGGVTAGTARLIQSRAANIPRVGAMDKKKREDGLRIAVDELVNSLSVNSMMIRRDGFPMQPVVTVGELRKVPDNRNMEDAVFLMSAANIDMLGGEELGLLSNTGVSSLVYVLPNGSTIRMNKNRPLTVGERRKLGKTVSSASKIDNSSDALARLKAVKADSGDGISLDADFSKIRNAEEVVEGGKFDGQPRWTVEAFKGKKKRVTPQAIVSNAKPETDTNVQAGKKISNLENAIEHINSGGNLSDVDPSILMDAIKRSKVYKQQKLGGGKTLFKRSDGGVSFVQVDNGDDFEHLGAHLSASMLEHLELPSPKVRIAGEGTNRPYLVQTVDTVIPNGSVRKGMKLSDMPAKDLAGIFVSDYLTDVRRRNPSTVSGVDADGKVRAVATMNAPSALAGLSAEEIAKRRSIGVDAFASGDGSAVGNAMSRTNEEVRRQILAVYEDLIQRARAFKWDSYITALKADGKLSNAEQRHMDIVKSLFEQRLDRLAKSKEAFASLLGLGK